MLSLHVRKRIVILRPVMELMQGEFSIEFELW